MTAHQIGQQIMDAHTGVGQSLDTLQTACGVLSRAIALGELDRSLAREFAAMADQTRRAVEQLLAGPGC